MPGLWLLPSPARVPVALLPLPLWRSPGRKQGCVPVRVIHWVGPRAEDGVEKGGECAWEWVYLTQRMRIFAQAPVPYFPGDLQKGRSSLRTRQRGK